MTSQEPIKVIYTNWRGETSMRSVTPMGIHFGSTEWHPEPQWLLKVFDHDKQADRDYVLRDCVFAQAPDVIDPDELLALKAEQRELLRQHFETKMDDFNDLLTVLDLHGFLGYSQSMITKWCRRKTFKSFLISHQYLIPKLCFLDFLASPSSFSIQCKSLKHQFYIREFFAQNKIKYKR